MDCTFIYIPVCQEGFQLKLHLLEGDRKVFSHEGGKIDIDIYIFPV